MCLHKRIENENTKVSDFQTIRIGINDERRGLLAALKVGTVKHRGGEKPPTEYFNAWWEGADLGTVVSEVGRASTRLTIDRVPTRKDPLP